ncbi:hypothetical protein K4K57_005633 [Colletotrichum sp. SAR 10_99]|nr:hypothetical protein K4K55_005381 [Colletotrichum sp. SAR 10_96]KAJ5011448.1 hypothetical protein K4K57_005633 [Colletotrichum sp. SAR 10_99]
MVSRRADNAFMALLRSYHSQRFCRAALSARNGIARPPRFSTSALLSAAKPADAKTKEQDKPAYDARKAVRNRMGVPQEVAIIGSGITGLTTAHYLAKWLPETSRITIYDAANRTGGWINTQTLDVNVDGKGGKVRFERGPRTLRGMGRDIWKFDDLVFWDLLRDLEMVESYRSKLPLSRYIYYDERLVSMSLQGYWNEPIYNSVFSGAFPGFITAIKRRLKARKEPHPSDMSVAEFVKFATGKPQLVDNLVSAMIHGIWGGDADKISMRSFMPAQWWKFFYEPSKTSSDENDRENHNRVLMPRQEMHILHTLGADEQLRYFVDYTKKDAFVYFKDGLSSLPDTIEKKLRSRSNVTFKLGEPVVDLRYNERRDKAAILTKKSGDFAFYDKVISTTTSNTLYNMTSGALPSLKDSPNVSIMAVNLWYPQPRLNKKHRGVGYLVPRSEENNPEGVLGVFFDSDVLDAAPAPGEPEGTKLFVLLGGHYWNDKAPPTREEGIEMAKSVLERQLGIPASTPCFAMAHFAKDCIPQHHVGHWQRMDRASSEIEYAFNRRVAVAGGSYGPIGVMGGMRAGYDLASHIARVSLDHVGETGLGAYQERKPEFFLFHREMLHRIGRNIAREASWFYRQFG